MKSYKEYMFYLLHAPFKRVRKEVNQWKILMDVLGEYMDQIKEYIFLIREQTSIETAQGIALDLIASGMKMFRFEKESDEQFRRRLLNKRAIAEMGGTKKGILFAIRSLGYKNTTIVPIHELSKEKNKFDGTVQFNGEKQWNSNNKLEDRWAEFLVKLDTDSEDYDFEILKNEVLKTKQASSLPIFSSKVAFENIGQSVLQSVQIKIPIQTIIQTTMQIGFITDGFETTTSFGAKVSLNGKFDGIHTFDGQLMFNNGLSELEG